jgi:hypothetical protein
VRRRSTVDREPDLYFTRLNLVSSVAKDALLAGDRIWVALTCSWRFGDAGDSRVTDRFNFAELCAEVDQRWCSSISDNKGGVDVMAALTNQLGSRTFKAVPARAALRARRSPLLIFTTSGRTLGTNQRKRQVVVCTVSENVAASFGLHLETLRCSQYYLTTILLPLLVGWRRFAHPRFKNED